MRKYVFVTEENFFSPQITVIDTVKFKVTAVELITTQTPPFDEHNLASLQSLSLFISDVESDQSSLDSFDLPTRAPPQYSSTLTSFFPIIPPSVLLSLQSTVRKVTWGQLCACRFKAWKAQTNWGHRLRCWHTHLCRWMSADTCR